MGQPAVQFLPPACTSKGAHKNCTFTYTGTALATGGSYPVVVSVAADATDGYSAASATANLYVTTTHVLQEPHLLTGEVVVAPAVARPAASIAPVGGLIVLPDVSSDAASTDSSADETVNADPKK